MHYPKRVRGIKDNADTALGMFRTAYHSSLSLSESYHPATSVTCNVISMASSFYSHPILRPLFRNKGVELSLVCCSLARSWRQDHIRPVGGGSI